MSSSTSFNIGDHYKEFLAQLTTSGRYHNASEAMREALRLLEQEEAKFRFLDNALKEAEEGGESSRSFDDIVNKTVKDFKAPTDG